MWPGHQFEAFLNSQTEHKDMAIQEEQKKLSQEHNFWTDSQVEVFFQGIININ